VTPASATLERLLRRGERARARRAAERVSVALTQTTCPEYAALGSLEDLETFHGEIALAVRLGAVTADRAKTAADSSALTRLHLVSLDKLADHLGIHLLSDRANEASKTLSSFQVTYPVITRILEAWARGKKVRGCGPEAATDLMDAIQAVGTRSRDDQEERILRRESVRLYDNSKRLERLTSWLEVLMTEELSPTGLSKEDVWALLGLRREPQPMLLAGCGTVRLRDSQIPLIKPYLGLPVDAVEAVESEARYVLTIENLASFHDAARAMPDSQGLLIYTAGMPSPAWRALYARILRALPRAVAVYHWGDIDEGGFRIAATLANVATDAGRTLQPWLMSPKSIPATPKPPKQPTNASLAEMVRWAARAGWDEVGSELKTSPMQVEQESIDPSFPD
jgi:hypothetical protein